MISATKEKNTIPAAIPIAAKITGLSKTRVWDFELSLEPTYGDLEPSSAEDYWGNEPTNDHFASGLTSSDQEWDSSTGLYNYDARLYNPEIGLFVTADSLLPNIYDPQQLNRYMYVRGNPMIYVDPTGHWAMNYSGYWTDDEIEDVENAFKAAKTQSEANIKELDKIIAGLDPKTQGAVIEFASRIREINQAVVDDINSTTKVLTIRKADLPEDMIAESIYQVFGSDATRAGPITTELELVLDDKFFSGGQMASTAFHEATHLAMHTEDDSSRGARNNAHFLDDYINDHYFPQRSFGQGDLSDHDSLCFVKAAIIYNSSGKDIVKRGF